MFDSTIRILYAVMSQPCGMRLHKGGEGLLLHCTSSALDIVLTFHITWCQWESSSDV